MPLSSTRAHGDLIFVCGQAGFRPDGSFPDRFEPQAELAMEELLAALADAGSGPADVLKTTVYIVRREDYGAMNEIYARFLSEPWPTRVTLVADLAMPGLLFEIDAIARPRTDSPESGG